MVTKYDLFKMLEELEIKHDDIVKVHSSLRSIGPFEGRADGLIDAFCEYLTDGLLIIPTHTWANVNKRNPNYDVRSTVPCIGTLPTVAAFRPDGVRSLHPTHSMVAFGKEAEEFLRGEENSTTPTPIDGALAKLYDRDAKILLIGVGHERNTYFHVVDEIMEVKNRIHPVPFVVKITDKNGNTFDSPMLHHHYCEGMPQGCSIFYPNYTPALEYGGAVKYTTLGNAKVTCCSARKSTDIIKKLWEKAEYDICSFTKDVPKEYYEE